VKLLRRKVFASLLYIKVDRPLPWRSVNLSWSCWPDSNCRPHPYQQAESNFSNNF